MDDIKNMMSHLKGHQTYPATSAELIAECDGLTDFSDSDKEWFKKTLPEGTYNSDEEVIKALGLEDKAAAAAMA